MGEEPNSEWDMEEAIYMFYIQTEVTLTDLLEIETLLIAFLASKTFPTSQTLQKMPHIVSRNAFASNGAQNSQFQK